MADQFYEASFGGVRLWISNIQTSGAGRGLVVHEPSAGPAFGLSDRGPDLLVSRCSLLFDDMLGEGVSAAERFREFKGQIDDKPRVFRHPLQGSFVARISELTYTIDPTGISAECTITQDTSFPAVSESGPGGALATGQGAVAASAAAARAQYKEIGLDTSVIDETEATVDGWNATATPVNPKDVVSKTSSLSTRLTDVASSLEDDLEAWSSFTATMLLVEDLRAASEASIADTASTFAMQLGTPIAARALVASIYGADEAEARYEQFLRLNTISNPLSLAQGVRYLMPQPSPRERNA